MRGGSTEMIQYVRIGVLGLLLTGAACGTQGSEGARPSGGNRAGDVRPPESEPALPQPAEPEAKQGFLETPFTAEQIRDVWQPGFRLVLYSAAPGKEPQRLGWSVVSADADGVEIERAILDDNGKPTEPPIARRSSWVELRDHARFAAADATRLEQRRMTPMGEYDGWVYTVRDTRADSITEYFFAHELPGPPVIMIVRRGGGGDVVRELLQVMRFPAS